MGITVEQWRKGLRGRVRAAFKDRDPARKKWSISIIEAKNPAKMISPKSVFFLIPMTMVHDHMPITQCTELSERARSQSFCWIMENWRSLSATRQNMPRPRLEIRDSVLQDWSKAWVFSVSDAITNNVSAVYAKSHPETAYSCLHSQPSSSVLPASCSPKSSLWDEGDEVKMPCFILLNLRICSQPMPSIDLAADTPNSAPKQRLKARGKEQMWDARPYAQKQERWAAGRGSSTRRCRGLFLFVILRKNTGREKIANDQCTQFCILKWRKFD